MTAVGFPGLCLSVPFACIDVWPNRLPDQVGTGADDGAIEGRRDLSFVAVNCILSSPSTRPPVRQSARSYVRRPSSLQSPVYFPTRGLSLGSGIENRRESPPGEPCDTRKTRSPKPFLFLCWSAEIFVPRTRLDSLSNWGTTASRCIDLWDQIWRGRIWTSLIGVSIGDKWTGFIFTLLPYIIVIR